ncbi:hypothetical protein F4820DRAFT_465545 [Hypoxylon rubiginosum]|uniref:Uncharacterized protein n=1 Tax=Hypoxylon rubiginosum TaxID=110542 RepID=A0ACB9YNI0_9PEZI|nr:hypothetical protein F4820DRAFT_465545 [Hypoxylon rubiginosum]
MAPPEGFIRVEEDDDVTMIDRDGAVNEAGEDNEVDHSKQPALDGIAGVVLLSGKFRCGEISTDRRICGSLIQNHKANIKRHRDNLHDPDSDYIKGQDSSVKHGCSICHRWLKNLNSLKSHQRDYHGIGGRPRRTGLRDPVANEPPSLGHFNEFHIPRNTPAQFGEATRRHNPADLMLPRALVANEPPNLGNANEPFGPSNVNEPSNLGRFIEFNILRNTFTQFGEVVRRCNPADLMLPRAPVANEPPVLSNSLAPLGAAARFLSPACHIIMAPDIAAHTQLPRVRSLFPEYLPNQLAPTTQPALSLLACASVDPRGHGNSEALSDMFR